MTAKDDKKEGVAIDPLKSAVNSLRKGKYRESFGGVNPTGASAWMINEKGEKTLVGKCLRQVWYSKKKVPRTNTASDDNHFIFMMGNAGEDGLQQAWEKGGILLEANSKMVHNLAKDPEKDEEIRLSGEVDAIVRWSEYREDDNGEERVFIDPTKAIGIEVKTKYGHFGKAQIMGNRDSVYENGFPQIEHLMQTGLYLAARKRYEKFHNVEIPYFTICYVLRDNGVHKSFRVELSDGYDGRIIVKDMDGNELEPRAELALDWGMKPQKIELTIDMMRERYYEQIENLKSDEPPAREYDLRYSDEKAERLFDAGLMSKTKKAKHEKDPLGDVGDWNCSYCDWKDACYPQGIFTVDVENGILTVDEALEKYGIGVGHGWVKGEDNVLDS